MLTVFLVAFAAEPPLQMRRVDAEGIHPEAPLPNAAPVETRWDDRVIRLGADGVDLFEPDEGLRRDVVGWWPLTDTIEGNLVVGHGTCMVVTQGRSGSPVRCLTDDGERWRAPLKGSSFHVGGARGDVTGDGEEELVLVNAVGRVFVLGTEGQVLASGEVGGAPLVPASFSEVLSDGTRDVQILTAQGWRGLTLTTERMNAVEPPASSSYRQGLPLPHPDAERCTHLLDRSACLGLGEVLLRADDRRGAALAYLRACTLGAGEGCSRLAESAVLSGEVDADFLQRGCRLGESSVCERWLSTVPVEKREGASRLACAKGYLAACSYVAPPPPEAVALVEPVALSGRIVWEGHPLGDVRVRSTVESVRTDKRGRFQLMGPPEGELRIDHPLLGGTEHRAYSEVKGILIELPSVVWAAGRLGDGVSAPYRLVLTGCGSDTVAVRADGSFQLRGLAVGQKCELRSPEEPVWTASFLAGEPLPAVLPPAISEVAPVLFRGPDGRLFDGPVRSTEEPVCAEGITVYEGYQEACHMYRWPVQLQANSPVLAVGARQFVIEGSTAWLEPGRWTLIGLGDGREGRVMIDVRGPAAVRVPDEGSPVRGIQVVHPDGRPAIGVKVASLYSSAVTDLGGWAKLPALEHTRGLLQVWRGEELLYDEGPPRDGLIVVDAGPAKSRPVHWRWSPLGLRVESVDERRVDLHPGDLLREACGYDVHDLNPQELRAVQAGRACEATVWRQGSTVQVLLPY